jgi:hypothetical protein
MRSVLGKSQSVDGWDNAVLLRGWNAANKEGASKASVKTDM